MLYWLTATSLYKCHIFHSVVCVAAICWLWCGQMNILVIALITVHLTVHVVFIVIISSFVVVRWWVIDDHISICIFYCFLAFSSNASGIVPQLDLALMAFTCCGSLHELMRGSPLATKLHPTLHFGWLVLLWFHDTTTLWLFYCLDF